jgi:hypothetical protein
MTTTTILQKQSNNTISHSPADDKFLVDMTNDDRFFYFEPGLGIVLLGIVLEPQAWKRLIFWAIFTSGGTALISRKDIISKTLSFISVLLALLFAPGNHRLVRFTFKMATLMRLLRVIEALFEPEYFEQRGAKFSVKFAFLYHDLRRAGRFNSREELQQAREKTIKDIILSGCSLFTTLGLLYWKGETLFKLSNGFTSPKQSLLTCIKNFISVIRFYSAITLIEAFYRLHLLLFEIKPPVCFDEPWKSQTIAEFWSTRWNQAIARQMRNVAYKPLAARGFKRGAEFGVFTSSALLHVFPIYLLDGSISAQLSTLLYFSVQPILMWTERIFKLKGLWWVQIAGWGVSPLFALPLLEVL